MIKYILYPLYFFMSTLLFNIDTVHTLSKRTTFITKSSYYPYFRKSLKQKVSLHQLSKLAGKKLHSVPHYYSTFRSVQKPSIRPIKSPLPFIASPITLYKSFRTSGLKKAIKDNDIISIKNRLKKGAPTNEELYYGIMSQPLFQALFTNTRATPEQNMEIVKALVEHNANINIMDQDHLTYMHLLIVMRPENIFNQQYVTDLIKLFKEYEFDFNIQTIKSGNTLLHMAIKLLDNPMLIVKPLVALGKDDIDINIQDNKGNTPLHIAIIKGDIKTARLLLENNANLLIENNEGLTPLDYALQSRSNKLINLLEEYTIIPGGMYPADHKEQD